MKKLVLISMLMAMLVIFSACSNEEQGLVGDEISIPISESETVPEDISESSEQETEEAEEKELDFSSVSAEAVKNQEIWPEDNIITDYAYDSLEYAEEWKKLIFSPDIAMVKVADSHNTIDVGALPSDEAGKILGYLDDFELKCFDKNSELNPPTGGGDYFGAYDSAGNEIWRAAYNGAWLTIYIPGTEQGYFYEAKEGGKNFDFTYNKPKPIQQSPIKRLADIYYTHPGSYAFDMTTVNIGIDEEKFTQIYNTVYDYSDGAEYQLFKADIKSGKFFMELIEPTEMYYIASYEGKEESTYHIELTDGEYHFVMRFPDDKLKNFMLPETYELRSLAEKLDLDNTKCRFIRIIGYASGILINDGKSEYFYVIGTGCNAEDLPTETLVTAAELAEIMFG